MEKGRLPKTFLHGWERASVYRLCLLIRWQSETVNVATDTVNPSTEPARPALKSPDCQAGRGRLPVPGELRLRAQALAVPRRGQPA